jgi:hypothetical protein
MKSADFWVAQSLNSSMLEKWMEKWGSLDDTHL